MNKPGLIRIIGGDFRGRKISFPSEPQVRPTPDRVRETLFNWLAPVIQGARCLDLFAGSGALGLEALSRGAREVIFIDSNPQIITHLKNSLQLLRCTNGEVFLGNFPHSLPHFTEPFDIVFLDPPFHQGFISQCIEWLEQHHLLKENSYIYLEAERELDLVQLPKAWILHRSKLAGQVGYHLANYISYSKF